VRKIICVLLVSITLVLTGCEKTLEEPIGFNNGTLIIDIFSNENFITYASAYNYTNGNKYFLELSVNIDNTDGSSTKKILKGSYFKAKEDTKILTDSILIDDVKEQLDTENKTNFNKLKYTVTIYNVVNGTVADGAGMNKMVFME